MASNGSLYFLIKCKAIRRAMICAYICVLKKTHQTLLVRQSAGLLVIYHKNIISQVIEILSVEKLSFLFQLN